MLFAAEVSFDSYQNPPTLLTFSVPSKNVVIIQTNFGIVYLRGQPGFVTYDDVRPEIISQVAKFYPFIPKALKIYDKYV